MRADKNTDADGYPLTLVLTCVIGMFLMMAYLADPDGACGSGAAADPSHELFCSQALEEQDSYLALYLDDRQEYRSIRED